MVPITVSPGSVGITPRTANSCSRQKNQVNAKAMTKYLSGKTLVVVVRADRAVVANPISFPGKASPGDEPLGASVYE